MKNTLKQEIEDSTREDLTETLKQHLKQDQYFQLSHSVDVAEWVLRPHMEADDHPDDFIRDVAVRMFGKDDPALRQFLNDTIDQAVKSRELVALPEDDPDPFLFERQAFAKHRDEIEDYTVCQQVGYRPVSNDPWRFKWLAKEMGCNVDEVVETLVCSILDRL